MAEAGEGAVAEVASPTSSADATLGAGAETSSGGVTTETSPARDGGESTPATPSTGTPQAEQALLGRTTPPAPAPDDRLIPTTGTERLTTPEPGTGADTGSLLDWRGSLSLELRNDPILAKYTNLEDAGKALVHQGRLLGRSIQIPQPGAEGAEAPAEEWHRVWEKLGWPKTPKDYGVTVPEMPEGLPPISDATKDRLLMMGHSVGMVPKQMQAVLDEAARIVVDGHQMDAARMAQARADGQRELERVFGADAPRRVEKARLALAQTEAGRFGGEYGKRAAEKLMNSVLGNDPDVIATFADIFDQTSEGQFIDSSFVGMGISPEALQSEIAALTAEANNEKLPMAQRVQASEKRRPLFQQLSALQDAAERRRTVSRG